RKVRRVHVATAAIQGADHVRRELSLLPGGLTFLSSESRLTRGFPAQSQRGREQEEYERNRAPRTDFQCMRLRYVSHRTGLLGKGSRVIPPVRADRPEHPRGLIVPAFDISERILHQLNTTTNRTRSRLRCYRSAVGSWPRGLAKPAGKSSFGPRA